MKEEFRQFFKEMLSGGYQASAIGLSLVISIILGGALGYWLAGVFDNNLFFYLGLILGIAAGFRNVYLMGKKFGK